MLVKYLIDTHDAKKGDEVEVADQYAEILLILGIVEKSVKRKSAKK